MRILITGKNGQVGFELTQSLSADFDVTSVDMDELDLTQSEQITSTIKEIQPDVILNAAAYTAVDQAEDDAELCYAVNANAPALMAEELKKTHGLLIHYSTDYVYDGQKNSPYVETDATSPLGVYGASKLQGDEKVQESGCAHMIFRTSWVYGPRGKNFFLTMLRLLQEKDELNVVSDQIGAPTSALAIAAATTDIVRAVSGNDGAMASGKSGLYHMSCGGDTSWYGFACEIRRAMLATDRFAGAGLAEVKPIATADYPTRAQRPRYTVMSNERLEQTFGLAMPEWRQGLEQVLSRYLADNP
jgi:dTDP-4-dehydrorhamnose reductase